MSLSSLSTLLKQVDGTQMGIQRAASAMMKLYDHSSDGAVNEWRNTLQTCSVEQLLPLLYVCNEVLQTSKRNRGNKFLESYGTSLVSSLQYMASKLNHPDATEKIRRVVKIWGDRQVFSIRFVNELLQGLEPYRKHSSNVAKQPPPTVTPVVPEEAAKKKEIVAKKSEDTAGSDNKKGDDDNEDDDDDDSDDDAIMEILEETNSKKRFGKQQSEDNDDEEDEDDDDIFGDDSQRTNLLNIEINNVMVHPDESGATHKRRGSMESNSSRGDVKRRRKSGSMTTANESIKLSMSHFMDLFHRLLQLHQTYEMTMLTIRRICGGASSTTTGTDTAPITIDDSDHTAAADSAEEQELQNLVGNELQDAKRKNDQDMKALGEQRVILYRTAVEQYTIEEMIRKQYLPWLDVALQQDHTDLQFCQSLLQTITKFRPLHTEIHTAYTARMEDDYKRQQLLYEQQRILKEKEENEKFRLAALSKETEAKPGMVWNPSTREYQALNTDESWRD